eukprot:GDKI01038713.1.p1 GENE.GDKI01038713.1~~GDKI01038713.1.p1  ORF type:complete len:172 (-),score=48.87 GDKI01038713.1:249-764(-)
MKLSKCLFALALVGIAAITPTAAAKFDPNAAVSGVGLCDHAYEKCMEDDRMNHERVLGRAQRQLRHNLGVTPKQKWMDRCLCMRAEMCVKYFLYSPPDEALERKKALEISLTQEQDYEVSCEMTDEETHERVKTNIDHALTEALEDAQMDLYMQRRVAIVKKWLPVDFAPI